MRTGFRVERVFGLRCARAAPCTMVRNLRRAIRFTLRSNNLVKYAATVGHPWPGRSWRALAMAQAKASPVHSSSTVAPMLHVQCTCVGAEGPRCRGPCTLSPRAGVSRGLVGTRFCRCFHPQNVLAAAALYLYSLSLPHAYRRATALGVHGTAGHTPYSYTTRKAAVPRR